MPRSENRAHYALVSRHSAGHHILNTASAENEIKIGTEEAIIAALGRNMAISRLNIETPDQLWSGGAFHAMDRVELKLDAIVATVRTMHLVSEDNRKLIFACPGDKTILDGDKLKATGSFHRSAFGNEIVLHIDDEQGGIKAGDFFQRQRAEKWTGKWHEAVASTTGISEERHPAPPG